MSRVAFRVFPAGRAQYLLNKTGFLFLKALNDDDTIEIPGTEILGRIFTTDIEIL
jgi:hypothetical protein